jgi:uncharacterized protein (DUF169 family)
LTSLAQDASRLKMHESRATEGASPPPVGVALLHQAGEHPDIPVYHGISYCDAVRRAGAGEVLRILPGSIAVCGWAPVVLGLKEPQSRFEQSLAPRLAFAVAGLLLAPLDRFPGEPDVVVVRARPEVLRAMVQRLGRDALWDGHQGRLDRSAVPNLFEGKAASRRGLVRGVNWLLAAWARSDRWQAFTHRLFRSRLATAGFDAVISRSLADMSVCRNSTAIPLLTGCANISFYCTGGITWGRNHPGQLTSGWPWPLFQQATNGQSR